MTTFQEYERLEMLMRYEREAYARGCHRIAGIDEAGRGPLAGPVVAAACILPPHAQFVGLDDSKKLSHRQREKLFAQLTTDPEVIYGIGVVEAADIDCINIYQATLVAMRLALDNLSEIPDYVLVDGMQLLHPTLSCLRIIKGDQLSQSIAAASILAKVTRDHQMLQDHMRWPMYGFDQHKGYGTPAHLRALQEHGPCSLHRQSFEPIKSKLNKNKADLNCPQEMIVEVQRQ